MSDEFPKALYKGDLKNYNFATAYDANAEEQLRSEGYVHFAELPEPKAIVVGKVSGPSEEPNNIKQELLDALQDNEKLKEENLDLKQKYIAENNALRKQVRLLELGNLDAGELRKILDEKQIKYGSRDGKDELVKLVFDSEYPEEE
ncbi:hypothetical protein AYL20_01295 [Acinetobacter venetianus]|uniref:hypothetical protein n=1 Tax=Acinetobacter venetianus TaxID=52133 RepID=UPI000775A14B|nr:hypothetical protein [Acinetobacter venetianus]KXO82659.1 hypothetical protein AYL20_01295 [Acinetobacter venetianus]